MNTAMIGLSLHLALGELVNQIPRTVTRDDGSTCQIWDDSPLEQLASLGQGGEVGNGAHSKPGSKPPIAIDVLALRIDIRNAVLAVWRAEWRLTQGTAAQLGAIVDYLVKSQQWAECDRWTALLCAWVAQINDLAGAQRPRSRPLPINCPACGERWQYADSDGETVRRPIMSALFDGETMLSLDCASCGSWQRGPALDALVSFMRAA